MENSFSSLSEAAAAAMNGTVDINSKSAYYDSGEILSGWGFTDNQCHNCGVQNSDLKGLLMQCAKCKRAYYCGMKCFNEHLPTHQKYCGTKEIDSEPKGADTDPVTFSKEKIVAEATKMKGENDNTKKKKKPKQVKKKKSFKKREEEPIEDPVKDPIEEYLNGPKDVDDGDEPAVANQVSEGEIELADIFAKDDDSTFAVEPGAKNMHQSCFQFGRGAGRDIPLDAPHVREEVDLRHAEMIQREYGWKDPDWKNARLRPTAQGKKLHDSGDLSRVLNDLYEDREGFDGAEESFGSLSSDGKKGATMHHSFNGFGRGLRRNASGNMDKQDYSWMTPEWIHAELRKTPRGRKLLESGDLSGPVTDVRQLIEMGLISWEKPAWVKPNLKSTPRGEAIKLEASLNASAEFQEQR